MEITISPGSRTGASNCGSKGRCTASLLLTTERRRPTRNLLQCPTEAQQHKKCWSHGPLWKCYCDELSAVRTVWNSWHTASQRQVSKLAYDISLTEGWIRCHCTYYVDLVSLLVLNRLLPNTIKSIQNKGLCETYTNSRKHTPQFGVQILRNLQSLGYGYITKLYKKTRVQPFLII